MDWPVNLEARERLARLVLKARGPMSRRAFADKIGVAHTTVKAWETGASVPSLESLDTIARFAGYSTEELLSHLEGGEAQTEAQQILDRITSLPLDQVALIVHAATDRLVAEVAKAG